MLMLFIGLAKIIKNVNDFNLIVTKQTNKLLIQK